MRRAWSSMASRSAKARDTACHSTVWRVGLVAGWIRPWCWVWSLSGDRREDGSICPIQPGRAVWLTGPVVFVVVIVGVTAVAAVPAPGGTVYRLSLIHI